MSLPNAPTRPCTVTLDSDSMGPMVTPEDFDSWVDFVTRELPRRLGFMPRIVKLAFGQMHAGAAASSPDGATEARAQAQVTYLWHRWCRGDR